MTAAGNPRSAHDPLPPFDPEFVRVMRRSGDRGYLAVSSSRAPIRIGVEASTEDEAVSKYEVEYEKWSALRQSRLTKREPLDAIHREVLDGR